MNLKAFKNRNGLIIVVCAVAIILIYSVDIMKLTYKMTDWQSFGQTPVTVSQVQYFLAEAPNVIGYSEPGGSQVSCATTVAYVKTSSEETYRCCDTGDIISCLARDFSSDIPAMDEACLNGLREAFAIPSTLPGATDYQLYGSCSGDGASELTVTQVDANGQILWKFVNAGNILILSSTLRCILAPALLILIIILVVATVRSAPREPIPRF
jgi:hypothetical protein